MQLFDMIRLLLVGFLDPAHSIRFRVSLALQARECLSILCNLGEEQTRALAKSDRTNYCHHSRNTYFGPQFCNCIVVNNKFEHLTTILLLKFIVS
jgi:hypothetical protein